MEEKTAMSEDKTGKALEWQVAAIYRALQRWMHR